MIPPHTIIDLTSCGANGWTGGKLIEAIACPFAETMGAGFLLLWGFAIFSGLAVYTRSATMPAVVAMLFVGLGANIIPAVGGWAIMRFVIVVAAALLVVVIMRLKR